MAVKHAVLSASSSERWLNCPPSARLCEAYEDKGNDYAAEGTDAHSLCEFRLKQALGIPADDPIENLSWYNEEMEDCAAGYAAYVSELLETAKQTCADPVILIEQRVDFSRWVQDGFGTADCIVIADGMLNIVDYKHGKGVEVSAVDNPQMMLYALGALEIFDGIYDIDSVRMTIYQPRKSNISVCVMEKDGLLEWAQNDLTYKAKLAYEGGGDFHCGEWCRFCKAKAECRERAEANLALARYDFEEPPLLTDEEIADILDKVDALTAWAADVKEMLFITLPSGRSLSYVKPKIGENRFGGDCITYEGVGGTKKWERIDSYGPKFVENIVQATSRDILCYAMKTHRCCSIVMHIHDEVVIEADRRMSLQAVCDQMGRTPPCSG